MSLLVISGISGAGKSLACNTLEDMGYYCIDNLPPSLLVAVSSLNENNKLAVVIDSRSKEQYQSLLSEIDKLKEKKIAFKLVFLYCQPDIIMGRYKYTRRRHPLISDKTPTLQQALDLEYKICKKVMQASDVVIDTSDLSGAQFRKTIIDTFNVGDYQGITMKLISFGFKNGLPLEADLVYDVRCMPNPFYVEKLKPLSGLDQKIVDYVFSFEQSQKLLEKINDFIDYSLPYYISEGKNELVIGIGCTSGHHRSVAFAEKIKEHLQANDHKVVIVHRDIDKEF